MSNSVRSFLRVRPTNEVEPFIDASKDQKTVSIQSPLSPGQSFQFCFDAVLLEVPQEEVYKACASDVVEKALDGYNGTVMCYGQTGAGKTFTMTGPKHCYEQRGLIPRALNHIFLKMKADPVALSSTTIRISYLEIYNEALYDLLDLATLPSEIQIAEDTKGVIHLRGANAPVVNTEAEALSLMFEGERNRAVGNHQLNHETSRSHCIFTISIEKEEVKSSTGLVSRVVSKLNMVDLAGSERLWKTKSEGVAVKEAGAINRSLSMLERVILALTEKNRDHVPYRSSKLTHLLKDSLGGNCQTTLVANAWGNKWNWSETLSTCRFAQRIQRVQNVLKMHIEEDDSARVKQLERELDDLKLELAMRDSFNKRSHINYRTYNEQQRSKLQQHVEEFLETSDMDNIAPLELLNLRHIKEILRMFKVLHRRAASRESMQSLSTSDEAPSWTPRSQSRTLDASPKYSDAYNEAECVGELEEAQQLGGVGIAPADASPAKSLSTKHSSGQGSTPTPYGTSTTSQQCSKSSSSQEGGAESSAKFSNEGGSCGSSSGGGNRSPLLSGLESTKRVAACHAPNRESAFEDYKNGPGRKTADLLATNKNRLKCAKKQARDLAIEINGIKNRMDQLADSTGGSPKNAKSARDLKVLYRERFTELQMVKSEVAYTDNLVMQCTQELLDEFGAWFKSTYGESPVGGFTEGQEGREELERDVNILSIADLGDGGSGSQRSIKSPASLKRAPRRQVLSSLVDNEDPDAKLYYNAQRQAFHQQLKASKADGVLGQPRRYGSRKAFVL